MEIGRRALLGAAAGALAAVVAACRGPEGETTFRPARTATTASSGSQPVATGVVVIPTDAPASNPVGTIFPTPKQGAPMPDLLRMIGFVPNVQDLTGGLLNFLARWKGTLTFANLGAVRKLYGYDTVRAFGDLQAQNIKAADYANATNGCYVSEFTGTNQGEYRDAFGYDVYQVDREISAGQPPDHFSRMEGAFDAETIITRLQMGGYAHADQNGAPYYTVRGDGELNLSDPRGRLALGRMNRVAASMERIVAAPKTELIAAALDAESKRAAALDGSATLRALATALGTVTSMATFQPGTFAAVEAVLPPSQLAATTRGWGTLHVSELQAMGYTDAGNFRRTMHVALVYTTPSDAAADAPELVKRLTGYRSVRTQQTLLPTYATAVTSRTATVGSKGVLIADIALAPDPARGRLWIDMFQSRDTLFLVPQPASATGAPPPIIPAASGSARAGTPRASGTP
ncbi:MAG: hypothetical protein M3Z19_10450 [Chloroflexota bacterium]|nr:hypothetical protein [Chloroflexota bacterium]